MTVINQGNFTSDGTAKTLQIRSDVDWISTVNYTQLIASTQWRAVRHYWQRGMATNDGFAWFHSTASQIESSSTCLVGWNGATYPGFTLIDTSKITLGAAIAVTAGTNAVQPVYSTANTSTLAAGGIVRIQGSAHTNLNGRDFSVSAVTAAVSFTLGNTLSQAPGVVAGANGFWRYVAPSVDVYNLYYPGNRIISKITQADGAVVTTLVDHGYQIGQQVRFHIPQTVSVAGVSIYGMIQMDGLLGTVTAVSAAGVWPQTFTVDIDSTGFTAFTFPTAAVANINTYSDAMVVPVGAQPSQITNLNDATLNQGYIGIVLGAGVGGPAGSTSDIIFWRAGKSFNV